MRIILCDDDIPFTQSFSKQYGPFLKNTDLFPILSLHIQALMLYVNLLENLQTHCS